MSNLLVNSGPGTGKSYTGECLTRYLQVPNKGLFIQRNRHTEEQLAVWEWARDNVLAGHDGPLKMIYMAYNKDTVEKSKKKVHKTCNVHTSHGAGYAILNQRYGYLKISSNRGIHLAEQITGKMYNAMSDKYKWLSAVRFTEKLKDELLEPTEENLQFLQSKYDGLVNMVSTPDVAERCSKLLAKMTIVDRRIGIEYIDQVWLPCFLLKQPIYDLGIIDEAQDLSPARLLLARKLCKHCIFIGDPDQAINAFAGADPYSFDKIKEICDLELPLKVSFRCPPNIIKRANELTPRAKLRGVKTEPGLEKRINFSDLSANLPERLSSGLIVCRTNAPLIKCALSLIKNDVPNRILGDRLITNLVKTVKDRKASSIEELTVKLDDYEERSCRSAKEYMQEIIKDKIDCIRQVLPLCAEVDEIEHELTRLLKPRTDTDYITLTTIHKAKGMERPYIYILFPPIMSPYAQTPEQIQQEKNLEFVATTRTEKDLYYVWED